MNKCDKCGHELFVAKGHPPETIVIDGDTDKKSTQLILRQYLACRNTQCENKGKEILNTVNLKFKVESSK